MATDSAMWRYKKLETRKLELERVSNKIKDIWPKTGLYLKNTMRNGKW
jgi:hypothetical protein